MRIDVLKCRQLGRILVIVLLFSFSFLLRWQYIENTAIIQPIRADAYQYTKIAYNLAFNHVFSSKEDPQGRSRLETRPPGYPFFLSGIMSLTDSFDSFYHATLLVQALMGAIIVILSYFLSRFLLPDLWSFLVAVLVMVSPHMIAMSAYILTETIFTFLLLLSLVMLLFAVRTGRMAYYGLAGMVLWMGIFVRPVLGVFPALCVAILYLFQRVEKRSVLVFSIALFLAASYSFQITWSIWKRATFGGDIVMASQLKTSLLQGTYPDMIFKNPALQGMPYRDDPKYNRIMQGGYGKIALHIFNRFRNEPLSYTGWWLKKPVFLWSWKVLHSDGINFYPIRYSWFDTNPLMGALRFTMLMVHPFIVVLALISPLVFLVGGKGIIKGEGRACYLLCFALLAYFTLMFTILAPFPRYVLPIGPELYLMSVFPLWQISVLMKNYSKNMKMGQKTFNRV